MHIYIYINMSSNPLNKITFIVQSTDKPVDKDRLEKLAIRVERKYIMVYGVTGSEYRATVIERLGTNQPRAFDAFNYLTEQEKNLDLILNQLKPKTKDYEQKLSLLKLFYKANTDDEVEQAIKKDMEEQGIKYTAPNILEFVGKKYTEESAGLEAERKANEDALLLELEGGGSGGGSRSGEVLSKAAAKRAKQKAAKEARLAAERGGGGGGGGVLEEPRSLADAFQDILNGAKKAKELVATPNYAILQGKLTGEQLDNILSYASEGELQSLIEEQNPQALEKLAKTILEGLSV